MDKGEKVLVLLTDMTLYADALAIVSNRMDQIPSKDSMPGSLYSDLAKIYEKAVQLPNGGSITIIAVTTLSGGDITHEGVGGFFRAMFIIAGFFGGAAAWWTMLAFVINLFRRRFRPRHMLTINHVAGLIIGILGIYTILSTFFDIFPNVG